MVLLGFYCVSLLGPVKGRTAVGYVARDADDVGW